MGIPKKIHEFTRVVEIVGRAVECTLTKTEKGKRLADMKPLGAPASSPVKEAFLGTKTDTKKKRPQVKRLSDSSSRFIKIGVYGPSGSGKTYGLADLIEQFNLKILIVSVDVGGDGLNTLMAELNARGRADLADTNVFHITLAEYADFVEFCEKPQLYFPDVYDVDIDMIALDGFSSFQQYQVSEYVESLDTIYDREGKLITNKYWGEIRNATIKNLNRFLYMHNKKTGKLWSKYVTMLIDDRANETSLAQATSEAERQKLVKDVKVPFIQGSAAKLIEPAFDFFAQTGTKRNPDTKKLEFIYKVQPTEKQKAKVRGVAFDPVIPGNMGAVWTALTKAYLITPGQVSEDVKEEVEVG